ncbi:DUF305 domain-containing protein [Brevundimonas sp.]|uniref:DUF305 domain-containing protein n=1 Tax=Brevundimonas sp. TaxID=1871086 RepID=UPI003F718F1F
MRLRAAVFGTACLLTLAACDGGGDPVQQALRETAAANQSATVAYDQVETAATPLTETEAAYARTQLQRNREAVAAARAVLAEARDARVRRSAQAVVDSRTREIAELEALVPGAPAE